MRVVPRTAAKKLSFFQAHLPKWAENAAAIGLSSGEVADIEAKLEAAQAAYRAQYAAQQQARNATQTFHRLAEELSRAGANAILRVRAQAALADDSNIYVLASLPVPEKGSPVAAPGQPDGFDAQLDAMGWLRLKWKCNNPPNAEGTVYELRRSVNYGAFEYLGLTGKKKFIDDTIPSGAKEVSYRVVAVRSTKRGQVGTHTVSLCSQGRLPAFTTSDGRAAA